MQYYIEISEDAKYDIKDTLDYYADISMSLKNKFEDELTKSIELILKNPLHYQVRYKEIRVIFTEVFPFGIHYIIENEFIYVLKILHTKKFFK